MASDKPQLKLYANPISQPSRAILWALKLTNTPFEFVNVDIAKGETRQPDFLKLNPHGKVPVLVDRSVKDPEHPDAEGFVLTESAAILEYLADKLNWDELLPKDPVKRARVHEYLHEHHATVRHSTTQFFAPLFVARHLHKDAAKADQIRADAGKTLAKTFKYIEDRLSKHKFLVGDKLTIADLQAVTEVNQIAVPEEKPLFDLSVVPHVKAWLAEMKKTPHYDEINRPVETFAASL